MRKVRIILGMLALMLLAVLPSTKAFAKKTGTDWEHRKDAPVLEVGKEYTIDRDDYYGADLAVVKGESEDERIYYRFVITESDHYVITFKSGGKDNISFKVVNDEGYYFNAYNISENAPSQQGTEYLSVGTYYLAIFDSEREDIKNVHASFSIAHSDKPAKDVNYVSSQEVKSNKQTGMAGGVTSFDAERLALSCKYTVGYNDAGSNINLTELEKYAYVKFYVEKDGYYLIKWDVESGTCNFAFMDPVNYTSETGGDMQWNNTCESMKFIKAGVYYFRVKANSEDFKGSFSLTDPTSTIKSITAGKKKLTVKVKKVPYGVEGYRIYYYTKKDRSDQQFVDITGTKGTYTIKKLKTGKKYYIDVTPLIIDKWNIPSFGDASKAKLSPKVK